MRERKFNQIDATVVQQNNVNLNSVVSTAVSGAVATLVSSDTAFSTAISTAIASNLSTDTLVSAALSSEIATRASVDATHLVASKSANQPASIAEDVAGLKADFNALLLKLKAAGIMVDDV